jgi:hypothetical protein
MVNLNTRGRGRGLRFPRDRFLATNERVTVLHGALDLDQTRRRLVGDDPRASHGGGHGVEKQPCGERVAGVPVAIADAGSHVCRKLLDQGQDGGEVLQRSRRRRLILTTRLDIAPAACENLSQAPYTAVERFRRHRRRQS